MRGGRMWATLRRVPQASFAAVRQNVAMWKCWGARSEGCRTTLHRMIDLQERNEPSTDTFINAVPGSFRPSGSIIQVAKRTRWRRQAPGRMFRWR